MEQGDGDRFGLKYAQRLPHPPKFPLSQRMNDLTVDADPFIDLDHFVV